MVRIPHTVVYGTVLVCAAVGCANIAETGVLDHFTAAIEKNDIDQLKASASERSTRRRCGAKIRSMR